MFVSNKKTTKLQLRVASQSTIRTASGRELVVAEIKTNKPIPPASHGTVRLRGKLQ
ncbi:hypothetical protein SAMN05216378_1633 [Paenibacillus catalpae]|uniref:Uncharacterized protein n=1 Tax=Paenibacillus catalpae TaxID=1045775 RepID=A0A1I1VK12_9BACL|nr:hypothetical protein [Paenibacillus catalpae]SFD83155.1 hypothetical protein SAMN05216378_1633 [Paenibacillus catalpae]